MQVRKRDGTSLEGVRINKTTPDGVKLTYTADRATITRGTAENPAAEDFVTVVIPNAKVEGIAESGQKVTSSENVVMSIKKL